MVAALLPFWSHTPSRTMPNVLAGPVAHLAPRVEAEGADLADGRLWVETVDLQTLVSHVAAWEALCDRALEPNVFLEPGFALPAARHFSPAHRPRFLLAWLAEVLGPPRLVGVCPVQPARSGMRLDLLSLWTHEQATLSAPLLDRERAAEVLRAFLGHLARDKRGVGGLLLRGLVENGPLWRLLEREAAPVRLVERRTRAVLRAGTARPSTHSDKEMRRQFRRLAEQGTLRFSVARSVAEVRDATERFLALEVGGWKGAGRTALLSDPKRATFARTMTRMLARTGKCRIYSLDLDDRPIAMGIVLVSGGRAYFWKTAYDQALGRLSPGKQLAALLTEEQLRDPTLDLTDSCAVPDHPMIDRLWPDRMAVADVLVPLPGSTGDSLERVVVYLKRVRDARRRAKALLGRGRRLLAMMRRAPQRLFATFRP